MRTFFTRCTLLGLLVGGFALTGDAGWILSKGQSLLNATTVPSGADVWGEQATPAAAESTTGGCAPDTPCGPVDVQVAPSLATPADPPPAGGGEAVVDLRLLRPGERVRVWVQGGLVMFDMVDPAVGEAIQQPITRRVRISGSGGPHRIERGGMIVIQQRPGISGHVPPTEQIGPVHAIGK